MLLDGYGTTMPLLFIVFVESVAVCWLYGSDKISEQIKRMLGQRPGIFWRTCWSFGPVLLLTMFIAAIVRYQDLEWEGYRFPGWSTAVGWLITMSSISCIPVYAICLLLATKGTFYERLAIACSPGKDPNDSDLGSDHDLPRRSRPDISCQDV